MNPLASLSATLAVALAATATAQVPDGSLVVATGVLGTATGSAGLWFVDPTPGSVAPLTPVTGLPLELRGLAGASVGSKCVARDPRSERLVVGNAVANGGSVGAWLLDLQGAAVVGSLPLPVAVVPQWDAGVLSATFLANGDVLLGTGRITTGPFAYQPILRWTPNPAAPPGQVVPVAIPVPYSSAIGNWCSALTVSPDGDTLFGVCKASGGGQTLQFDLLAISLSTGVVQIVPDSMLAGEFVAQLTWDCNGDLLGSTSRFPQGVTGRLMRWREIAGVWTMITPAQSWPGLVDAYTATLDPATCEMYVGFLPTNGSSPLYRTDGISTPTPVLSPAPAWGVVMGLAINPNPEVFEAPSGVSQAPRWSQRPFTGGAPTLGNPTFQLPLTANGAGAAAAFADASRTVGSPPVLGLDIHLPFSAVPLGVQPLPSPVWTVPIASNPALLQQSFFVQAIVIDQSGLGASDLLQFTIR